MLKLHVELAVAVLVGLLSHWTVFIHGEHDLAAANIARLYILFGFIIVFSKCVLEDLSMAQAIEESGAVGIAYISTNLALEKAEPLVYEQADKLIMQLQKHGRNGIDISDWLEYYTFDVMGKFGLTIDFDNLSRGKPHPILALYHIAHRRLGPLAATPWIKHLLMGIPYIERMKYYRQFMNWAAAELESNIKNNKESRENVIGYVLEDAKAHGGIEANWNFILGDFVLVIVAGSDPVRQVLANMMYYLIRNPQQLKHIREELTSTNVRDYKAVQRLQHLNACIYETLRLNPAVPSAGLRVAPPGGLVVNNRYIPAGTTILVPQYSLLSGETLIPSSSSTEALPGFTTRPDLILDKSAFVPWSIGKGACIGKNLSLMEIRIAAALILSTFAIEFAPGENGERMFTEACDYFTTSPGPLQLVLRSYEEAL
ncbi:MAG: hypothetical protein Q9213_005662 [Squamulea squamosa]